MFNLWLILIELLVNFNSINPSFYDDEFKCPKLNSGRNFELDQIMGSWYITNYYSNYEDIGSFNCMKINFTLTDKSQVTMNLTYSFANDPYHKLLLGNITWSVPNSKEPSHWIHSEENYDGFYDTYVLDTQHNEWLLLLHCAEKENKPRYLFSFIMSRNYEMRSLVTFYLKDKLRKFGIEIDNIYEIDQDLSICSNLTVTEDFKKFNYAVN